MTYDAGLYWPKISIVTPSLNQGEYLEQTILSVITQGYPNLEYIIIDGGSTDASVDIIRRYAPFISYWHSQPDKGQSAALNEGFRHATGEIGGWINADDYYENETFRRVAGAFRDNGFHFLCGASHMVDAKGAFLQKLETRTVSTRSLLKYWKPHFCPPQPSVFFVLDSFRAVGLFDEDLRYAMDFDFWLRASAQFRFIFLPALLSSYRIHPASKTGLPGGLSKFLPEWRKVIRRYLSRQPTISRSRFRLQEQLALALQQLGRRMTAIRQRINGRLAK